MKLDKQKLKCLIEVLEYRMESFWENEEIGTDPDFDNAYSSYPEFLDEIRKVPNGFWYDGEEFATIVHLYTEIYKEYKELSK